MHLTVISSLDALCRQQACEEAHCRTTRGSVRILAAVSASSFNTVTHPAEGPQHLAPHAN